MLNKDFYPTPGLLIDELLSGISREDLSEKRILEPSAGKGDIVDFIKDRTSYYHGRDSVPQNIDCIECDPELIATLCGKGYRLIHNDFLTFQTNTLYDLIIMNPPFSNGEDHLLHAWDILRDGEIRCILNAETVRNACTGKRRLLLDIIMKHGTIEFRQNAFKNAERRTGVEIAIIKLVKKYDFAEFSDLTDGLSGVEGKEIDDQPAEIAIRDKLENKLIAYKLMQESFVEVYKLVSKMQRYASIIGDTRTHSEVIGAEKEDRYRTSNYLLESFAKNPKDAWNFFFDNVRLSAWDSVFNSTKISSFATQRVREQFESARKQQAQYEFNRDNVEAFILNILCNKQDILNQCVVDAFDLMTKYHDKNSVHVEGWKSNKAWKINRKIILPYIVSSWGPGNTYHSVSSQDYRLDDIDRAMCFLSGENFDELRKADYDTYGGKENRQMNTLDSGFRRLINTKGFSGVKCETKFFIIQAFYKGTGHFYFKDEELWNKFNRTAAKGKNWLPDSETA